MINISCEEDFGYCEFLDSQYKRSIHSGKSTFMFYSDDSRKKYELEKSDYLINIKVSFPHVVIDRIFRTNSETLRNKSLKLIDVAARLSLRLIMHYSFSKFNKTG